MLLVLLDYAEQPAQVLLEQLVLLEQQEVKVLLVCQEQREQVLLVLAEQRGLAEQLVQLEQLAQEQLVLQEQLALLVYKVSRALLDLLVLQARVPLVFRELTVIRDQRVPLVHKDKLAQRVPAQREHLVQQEQPVLAVLTD